MNTADIEEINIVLETILYLILIAGLVVLIFLSVRLLTKLNSFFDTISNIRNEIRRETEYNRLKSDTLSFIGTVASYQVNKSLLHAVKKLSGVLKKI